MDSLEDLVTLNMTLGVGAVIFRRLREKFGSARAILEADKRDLMNVEGVFEPVAEGIVNGRGKGEQELELAERNGITVIPHNSEDYPQHLKTIYDPPLILYVRGSIEKNDLLSIAIVGARRCSHYGGAQAERFAGNLARMGFTIVSGLAQGIDTKAHAGALKVKGRTIAILGNGLSDIYPKQNRKLADAIAESGAVVSEFPMRTRVDARHFPQRNRVISGMSLGLMVVEASQKSGTLITANWALEQGKEVFALPGRVDNPTAFGTHRLIQNGAKLVTCAADILDELGPLGVEVRPAEGEEPVKDPRELTLNAREREVFNAIDHEPKHIDEIVRLTGLPVPAVMSTLTILEIKRLIKQLAGKRFVKA